MVQARFSFYLFALCSILFPVGARADRNVLAPSAFIVVPNTAKIEYATTFDRPHGNIGWVGVGLPDSLNGAELEFERFELGGKRRSTFSAQYSFTGNALSDIAPAISVGLRDALNQGREGRAFFAAASKTFKLSQQQERILRNWRLDLGVGTSHLGGAYVGVEGRFALGFTVNAEYLARRFNASIAFPVLRNLRLKAYSLNGEAFYGASFTVSK